MWRKKKDAFNIIFSLISYLFCFVLLFYFIFIVLSSCYVNTVFFNAVAYSVTSSLQAARRAPSPGAPAQDATTSQPTNKVFFSNLILDSSLIIQVSIDCTTRCQKKVCRPKKAPWTTDYRGHARNQSMKTTVSIYYGMVSFGRELDPLLHRDESFHPSSQLTSGSLRVESACVSKIVEVK